MNDILETIIELFQADGGYEWSDAERDHANEKWKLLSDSDKAFLVELSKEDLENICIGEVREEGDSAFHLYGGTWQELPPSVDAFLHDIWEYSE